MAISDDELRNHLARIYEHLRSHEEGMFDLLTRIRLGGHLKSGQWWTGQIRPTELVRD
jgi:hypothetical protein